MPMNELIDDSCGILLNCNKIYEKRNKIEICYINENNLLNGIKKILNMTDTEKKKLGDNAYKKYLKDKKYFKKRLNMLVDKLKKLN